MNEGGMVELCKVAGELDCISTELANGIKALGIITDVVWDEYKAEEEKLQHTCFGKRFEMFFDAINFVTNSIYDLKNEIDVQEDVLIDTINKMR